MRVRTVGKRRYLAWRVCCLAYVVLLGWLLLTTAPLDFFGAHGAMFRWLAEISSIAHFLSFFVLAVLAVAARWALPRGTVASCLIGYALVTEPLQGLVPGRTPDPADLAQDLAGLAAGAALCWLVMLVTKATVRKRQALA